MRNLRGKYRAEGGGELASAAQQKSARFHGLPDSEIYTTEYILKAYSKWCLRSVIRSYLLMRFTPDNTLGVITDTLGLIC